MPAVPEGMTCETAKKMAARTNKALDTLGVATKAKRIATATVPARNAPANHHTITAGMTPEPSSTSPAAPRRMSTQGTRPRVGRASATAAASTAPPYAAEPTCPMVVITLF